MWFVLSLDRLQLFSTAVDILILVWTVFNWRDIALQPSFLLVFFAFFINFIWQMFNVVGHFSFLKKEDPREPLTSMLKKGLDEKNDFNKIQVDHDLIINSEFPYQINTDLGVLENQNIVKLFQDGQKKIVPDLCKKKRKDPLEYVKLYKDTLLKFLNHRWYEVSQRGGLFTNDEKLCFASEIISSKDGSYKWRVTKGYYYHGYLTNFIYTQYVGGSNYKLFPPVNMNTDPIRSLGDSDFADHIGVSTLLYTNDGFIFVFRQAANAGYNANYYMPTGSGSMDFADLKVGDDLCDTIIRGAERELAEESSLKKLLGDEAFASQLSTQVIGYYRDMERGGKPEFCCVSRIDMKKEEVNVYIHPSDNEIAFRSDIAFSLSNKKTWEEEIKPRASLSLKMNYKFLEEIMTDCPANADGDSG